MKLLYLLTVSEPLGGAQVHVRDLATALKQKKWSVIVLVGSEGLFTDQLKEKGIPYRIIRNLVRPINPLRDCLAVLEIRRAIKSEQPDVVSTHSSKAGWLGRLACSTMKVPVLFTAHGWAFTSGVPNPQRTIYKIAEKVIAPLSSRIITVSESDKALALNVGLSTSGRIDSIHNGMPDVGSELRAHPIHNPPRLVMVARFVKQKDHGSLFRALHKLRGEPWTLDLIGDGPLRANYEALAKGLGLEDRVRFLGTRNDVPQLLHKSQIFILTSRWEGFPRSILEAMRAGMPVVASDVGGVKEAVIDGQTGYVVPRGDVNLLKERLRKLIQDPTLRKSMGDTGRKLYAERFTFDHMFEKTLPIYETFSKQENFE